MTQKDLARASRLSPHTVKDVEAGTYPTVRGETLHKLALGLRVRTSDLTAPGQPGHEAVPGEPWEEVRDVLYRRGPDREPGEPATPAGVLAALGGLRPGWEAGRYSQARLLLPGVVRDALALDGDDTESRTARAAALCMTAWLLTMTRQFDDAWAAARLALDAATEPPDVMAAVTMMTWGLLRQGRSGEAGALAVRWADRAEPKFSRAVPAELAAYGKVLLMAANAMATDNQPGAAQDVLSLARAAAARIGQDIPFSLGSPSRFGPVTVQVITAETAALRWQPDKTLVIAERIRDLVSGIEPAQRLRHRLDVASAHAMRREYPEAAGVMQGLAREAPEWLPCQQYARDIIEDIIRRRRGPLTRELRDLAEATRLPL